jgi:hypothetical protein
VPAIVYGDSTPFPYDLDFIALVRAVVDCGVAMLGAQSSLDAAVERLLLIDRGIKAECTRLDALLDQVGTTTARFLDAASPRIASSAGRVLESARAILAGDRTAIEREWSSQKGAVEASLDDSCATAYRALEAFLLAHDLPETSFALAMRGDEDGYDGQLRATTQFGLEARFTIAISEAHALGRLRRVGELSPETVVHVTRDRGWFRSSGQRMVRLDKLFVSELALDEQRILLVLRRGARSGTGYRIEVSTEADRAQLQPIGEGGQPSGPSDELGGSDRLHALRLASRVLDSAYDLTARRQLMIDASLDGETLHERFEPREICLRIIETLAPIVREIGRRAGAPGELVLRRNMGNGHRDEIFVTKAELQDQIAMLPPSLAALFDPFELAEMQRSPRAPSRAHRVL